MYISTSLKDNQEVSKSLISTLIFTSSTATAPYASAGSIASYGGNGNDAYIPVAVMGGTVGFTLHDTGTTVQQMTSSTPMKLVPVQHWIAFNPYTCYSGVTAAPDYSWETRVQCSENCHSGETMSLTLGVKLTFSNGKTGYVSMSNSCYLPTSAGSVTFPNSGWSETLRYDTVNYGTDYSCCSGTEITQAYYSATTVSTNYGSTNYLSGYTLTGDIKLYITRGNANYVYNYMSLTSGGTSSSLNNKISTSAIVNSTNSGYSKYNFALKMIPNLTIWPEFKDVVTWTINVTRPSSSVATTVVLKISSYNHGYEQARASVTVPTNGTSGTTVLSFRPNDTGYQATVLVDSITPASHTASITSGGNISSLPSAGTITTNVSVSTYSGYTVTVNSSTITVTVNDTVSGYGSHSFSNFTVYAVTTGGTETVILRKLGTTTIYPPNGTFSASRVTTTVNGVRNLKIELQPGVFNGINGVVIDIANKTVQYPYGGSYTMTFTTTNFTSNVTISSASIALY